LDDFNREVIIGKENLHKGKETPVPTDRIAILAIAYHNVGVEQEFLKKNNESFQSYQKGMQIAEKYLGSNHSMSITLRNSCLSAKRALMKNMKNRAV